MLFAFRILLLIEKKIAVFISARNHCQGYTEVLKNVVGTTIQKS